MHLALPCVMILDFIARIMTESEQKSKKNAKSKVLLLGMRVAILNKMNTIFTVKNWARSFYVIGKKKNLDLAYTRFRIHSVLNNVYCFGERIQEVADSNAGYTGYVWTEAVSGKKKLRIQKYRGACGWGLKLWLGNKNCTINTKLKKV